MWTAKQEWSYLDTELLTDAPSGLGEVGENRISEATFVRPSLSTNKLIKSIDSSKMFLKKSAVGGRVVIQEGGHRDGVQ